MRAKSRVPGYGVWMWNVAVVMPCSIAQSTVRAEHVLVVLVHAEDEAAVDHDAEAVQPVGDGGVVAAEVLALVAAREIAGRERLEADEQAAQPGFGGALDQVAAQDRVDRRRALEQTAHAAHALEQRRARSADRRSR